MGGRTGYAFLNDFWSFMTYRLQCPALSPLSHTYKSFVAWLAVFSRTPEITTAILARFCSSHWWTVWSPGSRSPEWVSRQFTGEGKTFNCLFLDLDAIIQSSYFVAFFFFFGVFVGGYHCMRMEDGGQKITLRTCFSPSTVWIARLTLSYWWQA